MRPPRGEREREREREPHARLVARPHCQIDRVWRGARGERVRGAALERRRVHAPDCSTSAHKTLCADSVSACQSADRPRVPGEAARAGGGCHRARVRSRPCRSLAAAAMVVRLLNALAASVVGGALVARPLRCGRGRRGSRRRASRTRLAAGACHWVQWAHARAVLARGAGASASGGALTAGLPRATRARLLLGADPRAPLPLSLRASTMCCACGAVAGVYAEQHYKVPDVAEAARRYVHTPQKKRAALRRRTGARACEPAWS